MNDKEQLYYYIPASLGQVQPTKWAIRLFYLYSGGGLQWFAVVCLLFTVFTAYRPKFWWWFVVVCGDLRWFAVVCGGLWWFAVVCLIVIPVEFAIQGNNMENDTLFLLLKVL